MTMEKDPVFGINKNKNKFNMKTLLSKRKSLLLGLIPLLLFAVVMAIIAFYLGEDSAGIIFSVAGVAGVGEHVTGAPLTTEITREKSPELLMTDIDKRITKIRPMSTPIDQIMRYAGSRKSDSMIVEYYSVDTKPTKASVTTKYTEPSSGATTAAQRATIDTDNNDIFDISDTILVKGVKGYESDGTTESKADIVLYVTKKSDDGKLIVYALNGKKIDDIQNCVPTIESGSILIRMGRAASELDIQTAQFESLPNKTQNYCQVFKMQIEQSTFQKITKKEVEWNFSDLEESGIFDMRLSMEKSWMFGVKSKIYNPEKKQEVMTTGGIWWQAGKEYEYDTRTDLTQNDLINIMKESFTGNAGNKRKVLIGGSNFIERINKLEVQKVVQANDDFVKWGIDFSEARSKFGKLYILLSEIFDDCGMSDYGFILDPEYLMKKVFLPFNRNKLDLKTAGIRNTDAVVLTEAACACLRYPGAHMRIVPKSV